MKTCKNCNHEFEGKYCNQCGQKSYTDQDKSLSHLFEEIFHFLTHFEGTFLNTLKAVLFRPGKLSSDYCDGIRKKYFKPISFYLMIIVLYLIFPLFQGLNMEMKYYRNISAFGSYIEHQIEEKITKEGITEAQLSEKFHKVSEKTSKILLLLFIPFTALFLYLLYFQKKRFAFDNFILATEINIFYLLVFYILFPVFYYFFVELSGLFMTENGIAVVIVSGFWIYSTLVLKKVMHENWLMTGLKSIILVVIHSYFIMVVYKALVFEVTFYLVGRSH